jgi:hypothetical protein
LTGKLHKLQVRYPYSTYRHSYEASPIQFDETHDLPIQNGDFPENNSILIPSPGMPGMMPCMGCMGGNMPGMGGNMPGMGGMPGVSPREGVKIFGLFQSQSFRSFRT